MAVDAGYRETDAGVIPADWDAVQLGTFISLRRGHDLTWRDRRRGRVPVMGSAGLNGFHDVAIAQGPGVVLGRSGASFGQAHYCERDFWPHNTALYVTDFHGNEPLFVFYLLSSFDFSSYNSGGAQPSLNRNFISSLPIGVPHPPEQRAISGVLSDVDDLLAASERMIAKKRAIKQAVMQRLLTGKSSLPGFDAEWKRCQLRELVSEFVVPMRDKPKRLDGDIPWCRIEDFDGIFLGGSKSGQGVDSDTVASMNLRVLPVGSLLVSCSADLGRCAIASRPLVTNQTFIGLVLDDTVASNLFLYYYLMSRARELNDLSSGTTISYLPRERFESLQVLVPCQVEEQAAIAGVLFDMDAEIASLERYRKKYRAIKQGMMQQLLTGSIRLVGPGAEGASGK